VRTCAERASGENAFLERGVHQDQQLGSFSLERLYKFQGVAGTYPQSSQEHLWFTFGNFAPRFRYAVRFAADDHVWLGIEIDAHPVTKQRVLLENQDSCFCDVLS
jgi:hypothetical protein